MAVDVSPIARAIENFGTGYANLALKKAALKRQSDLDAFNVAAKQAAIDLSNARTANEQFDLRNKQQIASYFDPKNYSQEQLSAMAVARMMGSKSLSDAAGGHLKFQQGEQQRQLFNSGDPMTQLGVATGRPSVVAAALRGAAGSSGQAERPISFSEMRQFYRKPVIGYGGKQATNLNTNAPVYDYDEDAHRNAIVEMIAKGFPLTREGFGRYLASKQQTEQTPVAPPVQETVPTPQSEPVNPQASGGISPEVVQQALKVASQLLQGKQRQFPTGYFQSKDEAINALEEGEIGLDEFLSYIEGVE